MVDGFPRTLNQAIYFEKNVVEAHQVIYYDINEEIMTERCLKRAETSGRIDDTAEIIKSRIKVYFEQTVPVVDYYRQFGKVRHIVALGSIQDVYAESREASLPECMFLLGPKACGKSCIAKEVGNRTNMGHIDFIQYLLDNGLYGQDDETVTQRFISHLATLHDKRIAVENFPQNVFQAKFFLRNGVVPSHVFLLKCEKDICQERMIDLGEDHPQYVASSILSKRIKEFHENSVQLMPFLKKNTCCSEIRTDQDIHNSLNEIFRHLNPTIINVRFGKKAGLSDEIISNLANNHGYINLDVTALKAGEMDRKTVIGEELMKLV